MSSSAININQRGLKIFESVNDTAEEENIKDSIGFFDKLDLMDFKDDLKYK